MTAEIKYTVKHHPVLMKKVANVFLVISGLIILLLDFVYSPTKSLTPDMKALVIVELLPSIFWHLHILAIICALLGAGLWRLKWRRGKLELTNEKLLIAGSYVVSIWLKNLWEVEVRDWKYHRWTILVDSNVDAVQMKFKTEAEFEKFSRRLISLASQFETIKLKYDE